jgi:hypothetical protein
MSRLLLPLLLCALVLPAGDARAATHSKVRVEKSARKKKSRKPRFGPLRWIAKRRIDSRRRKQLRQRKEHQQQRKLIDRARLRQTFSKGTMRAFTTARAREFKDTGAKASGSIHIEKGRLTASIKLDKIPRTRVNDWDPTDTPDREGYSYLGEPEPSQSFEIAGRVERVDSLDGGVRYEISLDGPSPLARQRARDAGFGDRLELKEHRASVLVYDNGMVDLDIDATVHAPSGRSKGLRNRLKDRGEKRTFDVVETYRLGSERPL